MPITLPSMVKKKEFLTLPIFAQNWYYQTFNYFANLRDYDSYLEVVNLHFLPLSEFETSFCIVILHLGSFCEFPISSLCAFTIGLFSLVYSMLWI